VGAGSGRKTIVDNEDEAFRPLLVATGEQHPVYEDWKAEQATARLTTSAAERRQLPLSVVGGTR
jgi:hypothetical protein